MSFDSDAQRKAFFGKIIKGSKTAYSKSMKIATKHGFSQSTAKIIAKAHVKDLQKQKKIKAVKKILGK